MFETTTGGGGRSLPLRPDASSSSSVAKGGNGGGQFLMRSSSGQSIATASIAATVDHQSKRATTMTNSSVHVTGRPSTDLFASTGEPVKKELNSGLRLHSNTSDARRQSGERAEGSQTERRYGSLILKKSTITPADAQRSNESLIHATTNSSMKTIPNATNGQPLERDNTRRSDHTWTRSSDKVTVERTLSDIKETPMKRQWKKSSLNNNNATEINNNNVEATDNTVVSDSSSIGHSVSRKSADQRPSTLTGHTSNGHSGHHHLRDGQLDDQLESHLNGQRSAEHLSSHHNTTDLLSLKHIQNRLSNLHINGRSGLITDQERMRFVAPPGDGTETEAVADEAEHPYLARIAAESVEASPIVSPKGTVRGVRNRVRRGISLFHEKQDAGKKSVDYGQLEKGRIVLYTTSVTAVRGTFEKCLRVKRVLQTQMVDFEERNVFLSKDLHQQLTERLHQKHPSPPELPQVFVDGFHLGDAEEIERLNESGILRKIFKNFKKVQHPECCTRCGGYRYIPCNSCHGSKKSRRNYFTKEFCALRCTSCDDNGLVKCEQCNMDNGDNNQSVIDNDSLF